MNKRLIYFDNIRAIIILFVVIFHATCVFATKDYWSVIRSPEPTFFANIIFLCGDSFMMGSFFMISGYFTMLSLEKYSTSIFIKKRIYRIGIPLLFVAIILNSLQEYILVKTGWINDFNLYAYILNGEWKYHLWFLINLIIYFLFTLSVKKYIFIIDKHIEKKSTTLPMILILFLLPIVTILLLTIAKVYPIRGIINSSDILMYLPFFIVGLFLKNNQNLMYRFERIPIYISLSIATVSIYFVTTYTGKVHGNLWLALLLYFIFLAKWFSISLVFNLSKKYLNRRFTILDYLSESSYSIYLVHHIWIVIFSLFLMHLGIGGNFGLFLLILFTILISLATYKWIISKNKIIYFLLNGTKAKKLTIPYPISPEQKRITLI